MEMLYHAIAFVLYVFGSIMLFVFLWFVYLYIKVAPWRGREADEMQKKREGRGKDAI